MSKSVCKLWWETCKALMPAKRALPNVEIAMRRKIVKNEDVCVYCGDDAGTMDHFRPVIEKGGMPSGFCDDQWNIVPACLTCNSSKGNKHWLAFMLSTTPKSPTTRKVPCLSRKIARLKNFEAAGKPFVQRWDVKKHRKELKVLKSSLKGMASVHAERLRGLMSMKSPTKKKPKKTPSGKKIKLK